MLNNAKIPMHSSPVFFKRISHTLITTDSMWLYGCGVVSDSLVLSATRFFEKPTKRAPRFGFMSSSSGPRPLFVRSDIRASWLRGLWERRDGLLSLCSQWWWCSVVVDKTKNNKGLVYYILLSVEEKKTPECWMRRLCIFCLVSHRVITCSPLYCFSLRVITLNQKNVYKRGS